MSDPVILYLDRSGIETDWSCQRQYFLQRELDGCGVTPASEAWELTFGTVIHGSLHALALGHNPTDLSRTARQTLYDAAMQGVFEDDLARDYAALGEGLLTAFALGIWPQWLQEFEIIEPEKEMSTIIEERVVNGITYRVIFSCRPDLLVRHRETGKIWYIEYKTTSSNRAEWIEGWSHAVQIHAGTKLASQALHEPVEVCMVQGLYKGYVKDGRVNSPLVWGWSQPGTPGVLSDQYSATYTRGWPRFHTSQYPGGVEAWILQQMEPGLVAEQFPQTPPIYVREDLVNAFLRQSADRAIERQVKLREMVEVHPDWNLEQLLDVVYPQTFSRCKPSWGHACSHREFCWLAGSLQDPTGSGKFTHREPHHEAEKVKWVGEGPIA